jgi:ABC-type nitrate/sulfonate/bicarbonate transport system substrate-binding protein
VTVPSPLTGEGQDGRARESVNTPLSSPVEGEEIRSRSNFDRLRTHRSHSTIIFLYLIGFLLVSTDAIAQAKKIRLCAPGLGSGIMHAYVAKERGYFAQEGLDLDVLVARGQICTMALLNGQMELSSNPNIFDAMVAGRFKSKVIYVSAKTLGHPFIVAPEIKSFDGLKQKNIAVSTFGGLTDMLTREILEQHGINAAKDVVLLQIGTPDVCYASLVVDFAS